jgi:hypothetical protein
MQRGGRDKAMNYRDFLAQKIDLSHQTGLSIDQIPLERPHRTPYRTARRAMPHPVHYRPALPRMGISLSGTGLDTLATIHRAERQRRDRRGMRLNSTITWKQK